MLSQCCWKSMIARAVIGASEVGVALLGACAAWEDFTIAVAMMRASPSPPRTDPTIAPRLWRT